MLGENSPRKLFIFRSPTYLLKYRQSQVDQKRIRKENNHKETTPIIRWDPRGARYNHQSRIIFSFSRYESKGTTPSFIEKLPRGQATPTLFLWHTFPGSPAEGKAQTVGHASAFFFPRIKDEKHIDKRDKDDMGDHPTTTTTTSTSTTSFTHLVSGIGYA